LFSPLRLHTYLMSVLRDSKNVYKFSGITDEEAVLIEPLSNAIHGLDKINAPVGVEALVIGSGPSGLMFAQLLKIAGASKVVLAANKGKKLDLAKEHKMADEFVEIDRENPVGDWESLKKRYSYGFDVVVSGFLAPDLKVAAHKEKQIEATGSAQVANDAIYYVRRGGTLLLFSVYDHSAVVSWPPAKIFSDEIKAGAISPTCVRYHLTNSGTR
jgi:D-arabinitol dehydrogenase (NADP+)